MIPRMWARVLDLRPGEGRRLLLLGGHFFLLLSGLTMLATAAQSIFLSLHPGERSPLTYIVGAITTVVAALAYGNAVNTMRPRRASLVATAVIVAAIALLGTWIEIWPTAGSFMVYGLAPGFGVIVGMESAGLVTRVLDGREARRLYPAISGMGGIGATIGSLLVALLSPMLGAKPVFWLSSVFFLLALPVAFQARGPKRTRGRKQAPVSWRALFEHRFSVTLMVLVSLSGVLSTCAKFVLDASLKATLPTEEIAPYLGKLYSALNAVSILFGFLITRRIVGKLGVGWGLLIYPLLLGVLGVGGLLLPGLAFASATLFSERLFRQNLQRPLINIATMPMPSGLAARANVAIRGAIENPAVVLTSLALLGLSRVLPWSAVFGIVAAAGALGGLAAWRAKRLYVGELTAALRTRRLRTRDHDALPPLDAKARALLHEQLASASPERVALAIELLRGHTNAETLTIMRAQWGAWPEWVRTAAFDTLASSRTPGVGDLVGSVVPGNSMQASIAQLNCPQWNPPVELLNAQLNQAPSLAAAAATRLLDHPHEAERVQALVDGWLHSKRPTLVSAAIDVMSARGGEGDLARIVEHKDQAIDAALRAATKRPMPELADDAVAHLAHDELGAIANHALERLGERATTALTKARAGAEREAAYRLLLSFERGDAHAHVHAALSSSDSSLRSDAMHALIGTGRHDNGAMLAAIDRALEHTYADCESIRPVTDESNTQAAIDRAVALDDALSKTFLLLSLRYPGVPLRRMYLSLSSGDDAERSFAVEALDEALRSPWRERIMPLLEALHVDATPIATRRATRDVETAHDAIASCALFRGLASRDIQAIAAFANESCADEQGAAFWIGKDDVMGLEQALVDGACVSMPDIEPAWALPLDSLWTLFQSRPYAGRIWLRNLQARTMKAPHDAPDVSHSALSIASMPMADDMERGGDLAVWQAVFYLRFVPLFASFPAPLLRRVASVSRLLRVSPGKRLIHETRPAGHAYVICAGTFEATVRGQRGDTLQVGDACGLRALFSGRSHPMTVTATSEGEVLAMDRVDFADLIAAHPALLPALSTWMAAQSNPHEPRK